LEELTTYCLIQASIAGESAGGPRRRAADRGLTPLDMPEILPEQRRILSAGEHSHEALPERTRLSAMTALWVGSGDGRLRKGGSAVGRKAAIQLQ